MIKYIKIKLKGLVTRCGHENKRDKMKTGTVKFFNVSKGFGFITQDSGETDVFVHANDTNGAQLNEGTKVQYDVVSGKKGPQASNVVVVK